MSEARSLREASSSEQIAQGRKRILEKIQKNRAQNSEELLPETER